MVEACHEPHDALDRWPARSSVAEQRLDAGSHRRGGRAAPKTDGGVGRRHATTTSPRRSCSAASPGLDLSRLVPSLDGLDRLYEQADVGLAFRKFLAIAVALPLGGAVAGWPAAAVRCRCRAGGVVLGVLPVLWLLVHGKRKRIKKFVAPMPDAVELIGRPCGPATGWPRACDWWPRRWRRRSPTSSAASSRSRTSASRWRTRSRAMADRVPTMDVRFFVTAIVIQRSHRRRPRRGPRQDRPADPRAVPAPGARPGADGRGAALRDRAAGPAAGPAGLPLLHATPTTSALLFTTPVGTKMLAAAAVLQVLGAVAIKKIVAIKV